MISLTEIILLAAGLCFDTFAVSLSSGICMPDIPRLVFLRIITVFALIQAGFAFAGWIAGISVHGLLQSVDHWIAFAMLSYIGIKMFAESFSSDEKKGCTDFRKVSVMLTVAVATSIDAGVVGVSVAMLQIPDARFVVLLLVTFLFTAISSAAGIKWGRKILPGLGKRAEAAGGLILIAIGVKILIEHLEYLS